MTQVTNEIDSVDGNYANMKMTLWVKRLVDALWYIAVGTLIIWPIATLIIGLNIPDNPQERHTDINFMFDFRVYPEAIQQAADNSTLPELIQGSAEIKLNNTKSELSWYVQSCISEIMGIIALFGLTYLRKLFVNLARGEAFHQSNVRLLHQMGLVVVIWNIIYPLVVYAGGSIILQEVGQHGDFIQISPSFQFYPVGVLFGLVLMVFAQVIKEAAMMQQEQSLTI